MFCFRCPRFFEPVRDVSFIDNINERLLIQDFINACDKAKAWPSIRRNNIAFKDLCAIKLSLKYEHKDFYLMLQIMGHMADWEKWDEWVEKRKLTQVKENDNTIIIEEWSLKHRWNDKANNVLLLAYIENLLALADKLDAYLLVEKILFQLEISLARRAVDKMESYKDYISSGNSDFEQSMEYKLEIYKIITEIPLPITYKFTRERWNKNKEYIESCESMKKILGDLQTATIKENIADLRKALEFSIEFPSVRHTEIYTNAANMLKKLTFVAPPL